MLTEKDRHFTESLIQATIARQIWWQPMPVVNRYTSMFLGSFQVTVDKHGDQHTLRVTDGRERELLSLSANDYVRVKELFESVRRTLLNVDETLDRIIEQIAEGQTNGSAAVEPGGHKGHTLPWRPKVVDEDDEQKPLFSSVAA